MRERGPDEEHVTGAGEPDVVGIDGAGREEAWVLRPQDPGTENAHARSAPSAAHSGPRRPVRSRERETRAGELTLYQAVRAACLAPEPVSGRVSIRVATRISAERASVTAIRCATPFHGSTTRDAKTASATALLSARTCTG